MTPSRDFMVRQAVLNAVLSNDDARRVYCGSGIFDALRAVHISDYVASGFCASVRKEYRALTSRYQVAA